MNKINLSLAVLVLCFLVNSNAHESGQNHTEWSNFHNPSASTTVIHHHYLHQSAVTARKHYYFESMPRNNFTSPTYYRQKNVNPGFSNALGAALGGLAGSKIGKGSGKLATTAAGTMFGYYLGGKLGADR